MQSRVLSVFSAALWGAAFVLAVAAPARALEIRALRRDGQPPLEVVREVTVELVGHPGARVRLALDPDTGRYQGRLRVPEHVSPEILTLKVTARDLARNRVERLLEISVLPDPDELGC